MGFLDLFRKKEEKVHFVRDEAGEVVGVEREYSGRGSRVPVSDRLLFDMKKQKRLEKTQFKQEQKDVFDRAFRKARLKRMAHKGRMAGRTTLADRFSNYSVKNNYNPFGSMFDTGMKHPKKSKSSGRKYAVVGGKAYPIVGKSKKKKKKTGRSSNIGSFNMFDNWGYMK